LRAALTRRVLGEVLRGPDLGREIGDALRLRLVVVDVAAAVGARGCLGDDGLDGRVEGRKQGRRGARAGLAAHEASPWNAMGSWSCIKGGGGGNRAQRNCLALVDDPGRGSYG